MDAAKIEVANRRLREADMAGESECDAKVCYVCVQSAKVSQKNIGAMERGNCTAAKIST